MGTIITATGIAENTLSSFEMTAQAGLACVEKAGMDPSDIDLLINVGIAHDENTMEPAMAPLILKKMGLNPDPIRQHTNFTMCFDLYNDACGFMHAVQTADAFLQTGEARSVLIVSGDMHPSMARKDEFPYEPVGAAVLLTYDRQQEASGFTHFGFRTSANHDRGFVAGANLLVANERGVMGKDLIEISQQPDFADNLYEFMLQSARGYLPQAGLGPDQIKFLVASQHISNLGRRLYDDLGFNNGTRVITVDDQYGITHTASLPLGLHVLWEEGGPQKNDTVLLASAGAGLTSFYAVYTA